MEVAGLSIARRSAGTSSAQPPPVSGDISLCVAVGDIPGIEHLAAHAADPNHLRRELGQLPGIALRTTPDGCTYQQALNELQGSRAHVFEYLGHAVAGEEGSLLQFAHEAVSVKRLGPELSQASELRLAMFVACKTGAVTPSGHLTWDRIPVPAVVAMQREIELTDALNFSREFHRSLSQHGDVERAMAAGRNAIRRQSDRATPVLYLKPGAGGLLAFREVSPAEAVVLDDLTPTTQPIVRANPHAGTAVSLRDFLDSLRREVVVPERRSDGQTGQALRAITPYFGPGALQVGVGREGPSLEEIWWDPELESDADEDLRTFLSQLLTERQGERPVVPRPAEQADAAISQVRKRLARLAHGTNRMVLAAASSGYVPVSGLDRALIAVPEDAEMLADIAAAIDACRAVGPSDDADLLGAGRILRRLQSVQRYVTETGRLRWGTAVWLTDLLWHAIICDSPLYPRVEELAMQVSIVQGEDYRPIQRLEPSSIMAPGTDDLSAIRRACASAVVRGYKADEPASSVRRQLYAATSQLLRHQYDTWLHIDTPHRRRPKAAAIALTTTFDLELERALAADGKPFHVAVPVYVTSSPESNDSDELRWLVGTFQISASAPTLEDLCAPVNEQWQWLASLGTANMQGAGLTGPLIVKLNGSPLHRVPPSSRQVHTSGIGKLGRGSVHRPDLVQRSHPPGSMAEILARQASSRDAENPVPDLEHAIALGEFDFLQAMRTSLWSIDSSPKRPENVGLPVWLCDELLTRKRYWVLIGLRLADWSARTQVFTLLMNDDQLLSSSPKRGFAVAREFDEDRLRFHEWLGLQRTVGDAGELAEAFLGLLDGVGDPS